MPVEPADRGRFYHVKEPEKKHTRQLFNGAGKMIRGHKQHQPDRNDFIPDNPAVIDNPQSLPGDLASPGTRNESANNHPNPLICSQIGIQPNIQEPAHQCTESTWQNPRQTTAKSQGQQMRGMGQHEAPVGPETGYRAQFWISAK